MKKSKTFSKTMLSIALAMSSIIPATAQTNLGADCGCPPVASRTVVDLSTLAVSGGASDGDLIATNTILTCDKIYRLDKKIYVPDGKSITINSGTLIKGVDLAPATNATALIVTRGGKIFASGTESCPIVFTAEADPMDGTYSIDNRKKWGGIILLGKAKNNVLTGQVQSSGVDGVAFIEGFLAAEARNLYGMPIGQEDDNDNSGSMSYVSIRHGGAVVGAANEINGLTLGSVGRGTSLSHIEVISNEDDGIEFFGGTVDLKYGVVMYNDDDGFDWDQGWTGRGQFWVVVKLAGKGDNGFESDGDDNSSLALPNSHPIVYNATFISGDPGDSGIEAKENTEGEIYNSILAGYADGIKIYNTRPQDAYQNWNSGLFKVNNCTFIGTTNGLTLSVGSPSAADNTKFSGDGNLVQASAPGFDFTYAWNTVTNTVTDAYDAVPNPAIATNINPPSNGFFCPAPYRGAFDPSKPSWMSNWTYVSQKGATAGLLPCPTDINFDGITNNADFLLLLGQFNQNCQ